MMQQISYTSNVGLGSSQLHVRDGMNCGQDVIPDNMALFPIVFASKSLSHAD